MNRLYELLDLKKKVSELEDIYDKAAYNYIVKNIGLADINNPEFNIGKAVIEWDEKRYLRRGFTWNFCDHDTNVMIRYNYIENKWGDCEEEAMEVITLDEFDSYKD
jgi:hypothetical protein